MDVSSSFNLILNEQPMGVFLAPVQDHHAMAEKIALQSIPMIPQYDAKTMMVLPATAPPGFGDFLFLKITVCSYAGLQTMSKSGVKDAEFKAVVSKRLATLKQKTYPMPRLLHKAQIVVG